MTDDELVRLARDGDTDAFDQLVQRHQAAVFRAALAALRRPEDAEEVTQDAFVRAWRSLRQFRGESSFRTWMLTIAWRRALSRRRSLVRWWSQRVTLERDSAFIVEAQSETRVVATQLNAHIVRAIRELTPKLRDALLLAQSGEYTYEDIAAMLKTTQGTVKWRVSEARRRIRQKLETVGYAGL